MRITLTTEQFNLTISSLTRTHRELAAKADGWSYNLDQDGDFDEYSRLRQQELEVAGVIHILNKQKNNPLLSAEEPLADWEKNNPAASAEEPLADWEKELLIRKRD